MDESELLLVRHGESQYNVFLTDNLDSSLTPNGIEQVKKTAKFLRDNFDHIQVFDGITSPYLRCLETARIIKDETGLNFQVLSGPREIMVKYLDGCAVPNRKDLFPEFDWKEEVGWTFPHETASTFVSRMATFVRQLESEKTLVVSHGTPINTIYELKLDIHHRPNTSDYVNNASISYIREDKGIWFGKDI